MCSNASDIADGINRFTFVSAFEDEVLVSKGVFGDDISVTMAVKALPDATSVKVSVTIQLCSSVLQTCLAPVSVVHEATFSVNVLDCGSRKCILVHRVST